MINLLHAGFDTLDVAFAGSLPKDALALLETARQEAQESQEPALITFGPAKLDMHVAGHGMRGGYAYLLDTGPLGAKWMVKNNTDSRQWNLFASPRATTLLAYGFEGTRDLLQSQLEAMGARVTDHAVNRVDFAMDFQTQGFELHQDQFVAHSHTKVTPHWGKQEVSADRNQPAAVLRGRRLESVTIGKQPGRQVIVYDKRREAVERQKPFWFEVWGLDREDPTLEVWRVELRAGKKELKEKYGLRTFRDVADSIGDVFVNALQEVRYLADGQRDSNVSRQTLHPLWIASCEATQSNLLELRSGLTRGQVKEIERSLAIERYTKLLFGNAMGLSIALGYSDQRIKEELVQIVTTQMKLAQDIRDTDTRAKISRTRKRLHFLIDSKASPDPQADTG